MWRVVGRWLCPVMVVLPTFGKSELLFYKSLYAIF